ncbi:hypothetical protein H7I41_26445, partial [Mycobacterium manitobense]|nr:hypothetical protein [[Mycobacterium] manitobense]
TRYPQRPEAARAEGPAAGRAGGPSPVRAEPSRRPPQARNARQSPHFQR